MYVFAEASLFSDLASSLGASINYSKLCIRGYQIGIISFYLNFIFLLAFQTRILENLFTNNISSISFNSFDTNLQEKLEKYAYPKHIFKIIYTLLICLSISIMFETVSIPQFTEPPFSSEFGCKWKLSTSSADTNTSLAIVIWSCFNGLFLFFIK